MYWNCIYYFVRAAVGYTQRKTTQIGAQPFNIVAQPTAKCVCVTDPSNGLHPVLTTNHPRSFIDAFMHGCDPRQNLYWSTITDNGKGKSPSLNCFLLPELRVNLLDRAHMLGNNNTINPRLYKTTNPHWERGNHRSTENYYLLRQLTQQLCHAKHNYRR